jgi:hypothetical protein
VIEAASVVAAVAAVGALYLAWRTVAEGRAARREDERDRRLARLERLCIALTAQGRITQARARVLWVTTGMELSEDVRFALVTPITAINEDEIADRAETSVEIVLTGLEDYLQDAVSRSRNGTGHTST